MINAKELRRGNLFHPTSQGPVNLPSSSIVWQVITIGLFQIEAIGLREKIAEVESPLVLRYEQLHPVPLTEEWLLKFGFKKVDAESGQIYAHYKKGEWKINFENGDYVFWRNDFQVDIKYIHQLQNLYFALTNTELNQIP